MRLMWVCGGSGTIEVVDIMVMMSWYRKALPMPLVPDWSIHLQLTPCSLVVHWKFTSNSLAIDYPFTVHSLFIRY